MTIQLNLDTTLTTEDSDLVDAKLELLAEKALKAAQKAAAAELASKSAAEELKTALEAAGRLTEDTKAIGPVRTTIYPTVRFNETLARAGMSKKLQKECEKTTLDSALVKAKVTPEQYKSFQKASGWTLKLSVAD